MFDSEKILFILLKSKIIKKLKLIELYRYT
jgi:hypothetical protein